MKDNVNCDVQIENYDSQQYSSLRNTVFNFVTGKNEILKQLVIP